MKESSGEYFERTDPNKWWESLPVIRIYFLHKRFGKSKNV